MGFKQSTSDPCIYTSTTDGLFILAVYVDDILLAAKSQQKIDEVKADLGKQFHVKDMGEHYFLGVNVKQNLETGKVWIGQQAYTEAVINKLGMENSKPHTSYSRNEVTESY